MTTTATEHGTRLAHGLLVVDSFYVCGARGDEPYYEVQLASDREADTPRLTLLTRSLDLFRTACDADATDQRVDAEFRPAKRQDGRSCQQLIALWRSV
jgi:hypothetical protein